MDKIFDEEAFRACCEMCYGPITKEFVERLVDAKKHGYKVYILLPPCNGKRLLKETYKQFMEDN